MAASAPTAPQGAHDFLLRRTPDQILGPFYPVRRTPDRSGDLTQGGRAQGLVLHLSGIITRLDGTPVEGAEVQVWQANRHGRYLHDGDVSPEPLDPHFEGFGELVTGADGRYAFTTIKPIAYPGRAPHIHVAVKMKGREKWTTQCYIKGEKQNETDMVIRGIKDKKQRASVIVDFSPLPGVTTGELAARFDIVMGFTPAG